MLSTWKGPVPTCDREAPCTHVYRDVKRHHKGERRPQLLLGIAQTFIADDPAGMGLNVRMGCGVGLGWDGDPVS